MKALSLLKALEQHDVTEFAMVSGRLPCVKIKNEYQPVSQNPLSTLEIFDVLTLLAGNDFVSSLNAKATQCSVHIENLGPATIVAVLRNHSVQVRITLARTAQPIQSSSISQSLIQHDFSYTATKSQRPKSTIETEVEQFATAFTSNTTIDSSTLDHFLREVRIRKASDVHIIAERPVLFRIAGELVANGPLLTERQVFELINPCIPQRLRSVFETQGSCDFALAHEIFGRFRCNVTRQRTGLKASFRAIAEQIPTFDSLGLPSSIAGALYHHQGLIVITGPTGHGKTSTLAAFVHTLNESTTHHIITIEDPIEFLHPRKRALMSQREVGTHTKSFSNALKSALREDPDVIVVGELRDVETVRMALSASETGHLVLGTMNTPNAAKTIDRLIDLFPPGDQPQVRFTLAGGLRLIVSQRLVPMLGPDKQPNGQRVAAFEVLPGSIALWNLIRENKTYQISSLQQRGKSLGILRFDDSLLELVRSGKTKPEWAKIYAEAPDEFEVWFHQSQEIQPIEASMSAPKDSVFSRAGNLIERIKKS